MLRTRYVVKNCQSVVDTGSEAAFTPAAAPRRERAMRRMAIIIAGILVVAGVIAGPASALKNGKPGGGSGSTGSYTVTVSPAGPYSFGEEVWTTTDAPIYPNNAGP